MQHITLEVRIVIALGRLR